MIGSLDKGTGKRMGANVAAERGKISVPTTGFHEIEICVSDEKQRGKEEQGGEGEDLLQRPHG